MYYCPRHAVKELRGKGVAIIMSIINSIIEQDQQTRICFEYNVAWYGNMKELILGLNKKETEFVVLFGEIIIE